MFRHSAISRKIIRKEIVVGKVNFFGAKNVLPHFWENREGIMISGGKIGKNEEIFGK